MLAREWRFLRRTTVFWIALTTAWSALGLGAWHGVRRWHHDRAEAKSLNEQTEAKLERNKVRLLYINKALASPHPETITRSEFEWGPRQTLWADAWDPPTSVLPEAPLAFLATGRSDTLPHSYVSSAWRGLEPNAPTMDDPVTLLTGDFDLKFVILDILPLLIVLLCFDLLATEREDGTLRLILAQSISFSSLLVARATVRGLFIAASGVIAMLAACVAVAMDGGNIWPGRFAAYVAVVWVYLFFWILMAVFVNTFNGSGMVNSLVLGGSWLLMVILLPGILPVVAESVAPTPSRAFYIDLARAARLGIYNGAVDKRATHERQQSMLNAFLVRHPEWANDKSLNRTSLLGAARGEEHSAMLKEITDRFETAHDRQRRVIGWLSIVSPALVADRILTRLSGNSDERQQMFLDQSVAFFDKSKQYFWPRIFRWEIFTPQRFSEIPRFHFSEESGSEIGISCVPLCAVLLLWAIGIALLTWKRLSARPVL